MNKWIIYGVVLAWGLTISCSEEETVKPPVEPQLKTRLGVIIEPDYPVDDDEWLLVTSGDSIVDYVEVIPGRTINIQIPVNQVLPRMDLHRLIYNRIYSRLDIVSVLNYEEEELVLKDTVLYKPGNKTGEVQVSFDAGDWRHGPGEYFVSLAGEHRQSEIGIGLDNNTFEVFDNSNTLFFYRFGGNVPAGYYFDPDFNMTSGEFRIEDDMLGSFGDIYFRSFEMPVDRKLVRIEVRGLMEPRNGRSRNPVVFYQQLKFDSDRFRVIFPENAQGIDSIQAIRVEEDINNPLVRYTMKYTSKNGLYIGKPDPPEFEFIRTKMGEILVRTNDDFFSEFIYNYEKVFRNYAVTWEVHTSDLDKPYSAFPAIPNELQERWGTHLPEDMDKPSIDGYQEKVTGRLVRKTALIEHIFEKSSMIEE